MTADGFLNQKRRHPVAMVAALSINIAAVTALMLAKMGGVPFKPEIIELINPTLDPPPPEPIKERPKVDTPAPESPLYTPPRQVETEPVASDNRIEGTPVLPLGGNGAGADTSGTRVEPEVIPTPLPVLTDAVPLASAARDFQPPYPSVLLRTGVEGKAVLRVLIGSDGRVKQVAIISADDPLFADAAERQALRKWRFKPATRDGQPVETWKQLTVRFEIRS
jgi:protein TonB